MTIDFALLHGGGQGDWVWDQTIAAIAARIDAGHQAMNTRPHALAEILLAEAAA